MKTATITLVEMRVIIEELTTIELRRDDIE